MNRIDRLVALLTTLQSRRFVTAEFIADKYGISVRTVYRDLKALGEMGVPIVFEPNKGYNILQGYFLPPVTFTAEEAHALILMASLAERFADKSIRKNTETALDKIKSVLRHTEKEKADFLHSRIRVYMPPLEENNSDYLSVIQNAVANKNILAIEYENNEGIRSKREIEPIGLTFYSRQWHVIAWCWKRIAYRDFKTGQILRLWSLDETFRKKDHWDINQYIQSLPE